MKTTIYTEDEYNALVPTKVSKKLLRKVGTTINNIQVLGKAISTHTNKPLWFVRCFCGNIFSVASLTKIESGHTKSCTCTKTLDKDKYYFDKFKIKLLADYKGSGYDVTGVTFEDWKSRGDIPVVCSIYGNTKISLVGIRAGTGCFKCGKDRAATKRFKTTEQFILDAKQVHGDMYDYKDTIYKGAHENLDIYCPVSKQIFSPTATDHLSGCKCSCCWKKGGFSYEREGTLYLSSWLTSDGISFLKIGVTNQSAEKRLKDQKSNANRGKVSGEVLYSKLFPVGRQAYNAEQEILRTFGKNFIDKDVLPDGHKETIDPIHKKDILEFLNTL